jgi:TatD DNase family protein
VSQQREWNTLWIDSHCHLHTEEDPKGLAEEAAAVGVKAMVAVGTSVESSRQAVEVANQLTNEEHAVWATVGVHPHEADEGLDGLRALLEELGQAAGGLEGQRVIGIGECGLDYHYDHSSREAQRKAFFEQAQMARKFGLTLVVHTREAWEDTFAILTDAGCLADPSQPSSSQRVVIHCFTGGPREAETCLELGAFISLSGIVTFKNAEEVRQAALMVPSERLLVETDAPYLAPVPHRGKPNRPAWVAVVGEALAKLRCEDVTEFAAATRVATVSAFGLGGLRP